MDLFDGSTEVRDTAGRPIVQKGTRLEIPVRETGRLFGVYRCDAALDNPRFDIRI
jgi:hypothetical protein